MSTKKQSDTSKGNDEAIREHPNDRRNHVDKSKICSLWMSLCKVFHTKMEKMFASSSANIAMHPKLAIMIGLAVVGCLSIGFIWLNLEKRTVKIFVPQDSQAMKDLAKAEKHFRLNVRQETIIIIPQGNQEVLSTSCFTDILQIHNTVTHLPLYSKLCTTIGNDSSNACMFLNPLELFNLEKTNIFNVSSRIKEKVSCHSSFIMSNGRTSCENVNLMFGTMTRDVSDFSRVHAIRLVYYLKQPDTDLEYSRVILWEDDLMKTLKSQQEKMTCAKMLLAAERSLDDAIEASTSSDTKYFALTFTIMINFANIMLGKVFRNPLTGHSLLGTGGVICVGLGIAAGFGLSTLSLTPFVNIVGVLPFLVVGVAIDDMFIIIDELDRQSRDWSVTKTVSHIMSRTGPTITMTTATDLVAFAVSTKSQFPSIQYFCTYAALTITFAYLMIVTVFVALMTFDLRRIRANRRNCLPICFAPHPKDGHPPWDEPRQSVSSRIMERWGEQLIKPTTKVIVVVLSLGLLGAGVYGTLKTNEGFNRSLLVPDGSPYKEFVMTKEKYFDRSIEFSVILDKPLDYSTTETQTAIKKLGHIIQYNKYCKNQTSLWINQFQSYCRKNNLVSEGQFFMENVRKFLEDPSYRHFTRDIKFSADQKSIAASRVVGHIKGSDSSVFQREAMLTLRQDLSRKSTIPVYPIARSFIFLEQYVVIVQETIKNLSVAAVSILVITSPFLVDIKVALLVFFSFVSLIFELFALMVVWEVSLNSISMINLVMAIGFSVDYSAHIALSFLKSTETTSERRVVDSLRSVGASVFLGGISTLLGISLTSLSNSEIFRIFFKMFFGMVILGLLHGLVFLPVYLATFGKWSICLQIATTIESQVDDVHTTGDNVNLGSDDIHWDKIKCTSTENNDGQIPNETNLTTKF